MFKYYKVDVSTLRTLAQNVARAVRRRGGARGAPAGTRRRSPTDATRSFYLNNQLILTRTQLTPDAYYLSLIYHHLLYIT